jgi:hypothetical protein
MSKAPVSPNVQAPGASIVRVIDTPWLKPEEAAVYARRSLRTIEGWIHEGSIDVSYPDSHPLIHKKSLDAKITKKTLKAVV